MLDVTSILAALTTIDQKPVGGYLDPRRPPIQSRPALTQLSEELRESEARYRMLFEAIDEGFCIIEQMQSTPDGASDFRYVEANPAFKRQSGISDVVGQTLRQVLPGECEEWIATYNSVVETGQALRFERGLIGQGRVLELYAFPVGEAKLGRVGVSFRDITERKRSEDLLRRNRDTFFNLVENAPFGLYVVDAQFCLHQVSTAAQKVFSHVSPLIGRDFEEVLRCVWDEPFVSEALARFRHTLATGEAYAAPNTTQPRHDSPDVESYDWKIERITLPDGQFGVACYFYDITERKLLEREAQQLAVALQNQDRRKNEFLAMLGHELRNPLAPIMSAVHLLSLQTDETPLHRKARQVIERQTRQLKMLVEDLLEVSRITSGRIQLQCAPITVAGVLERAAETVQPMTAQRRQVVVLSLPPQDVWLHADAARLEQVVVNLLTNASKYSNEEGDIWMTAGLDGDTLMLSVRDTGIGIAAELLPHVFELFTQAERSLDRAEGGLGIGLCLVQRLVELHGGTVQARSVLGQGSEFTVRLPVMAASPAPVSVQPQADETTAPAPARRRVLVVDDNADVADSLKDLLEVIGHDTQVASNGRQALDAVDSFRPEIVLLDIGLPGMSGLEVARRLRALPALDNTLLVAMTGYGQQSDRDRTLAAGFDHHLVKPVEFDSLQKILDSIGMVAIEASS